MTLGERISFAIKELNITKKKFAESLSISPGNLSDWINPARKSNPTADALIRINELYGIDITWLLTGKGEMRRQDSSLDSVEVHKLEDFIEKLNAELSELKGKVTVLEKENAKLCHELVDRLREVCALQAKLIPDSL